MITNLFLLPENVCTACIAKMVRDFDSDDTMDALLKEALTELAECRLRPDRTAGKKHASVTISSSTPTLKNLTKDLVFQGEGSSRGKGYRG